MHKNQIDLYLKLNPFSQLSNVVFNILVDEISDLNLQPGTKLNILQISDDLGISRTPVREALIKLYETGFVETFPDKAGYYVSNLEINDIEKIYFIRAMIESKAIFLCAKNNNIHQINKLKEAANDLKEPYKDLDILTLYDYNFHKQIIISSGNEYLFDIFNLIEKKIKRSIKINYQFLINNNQINEIEKITTDHNSICNIISNDMPELAEKEIENHINGCLNETLLRIGNL